MDSTQIKKLVKSANPGPSTLLHRKLLVVKRVAHARYGSHRNVIGVGLGTKFKRPKKSSARPEKIPEITCIQFFVRRKTNSLPKSHQLPGFVYGRTLSGKIDYRQKIPTDVIVMGKITATCAGDQLDSNTEHGLITLIFKNKADPTRPFFLLTCAHVTGDVNRSPPPYDELTSNCSTAQPFANTIVNSTAKQGEVAYDIALAKISGDALPLAELGIKGQTGTIAGFFPENSIQRGVWVDAVLRANNPRGNVDSLHASAEIQYGSRVYVVHNLFGVNVPAQKGDSGGLVYQNSQAVGIVVAASSEGWLWFQPLESAFKYLQSISPIQLQLFDNP